MIPAPARAATASISVTSPYESQLVAAPFTFRAYATAPVQQVNIGVYLTGSPTTGLLDICDAKMEGGNPQVWMCDTISFEKITGNGDNKYYAIARIVMGDGSYAYSSSVPFIKSGAGIPLSGIYLESPKSTDNPAPGAPLPLTARTTPAGAIASKVEFNVLKDDVPVSGSPFIAFYDQYSQTYNYGTWYPTVGAYSITPKAYGASGVFTGAAVTVNVGQGQYPTAITIEAPTANASFPLSQGIVEFAAKVEPTTLSDAVVSFSVTSVGGAPPQCAGVTYDQAAQRYKCKWYPTAAGSYSVSATAYKTGQSVSTAAPTNFSVTDSVPATGIVLESPKATDNPAPGTVVQLKARLVPDNATASKVDFFVSDSSGKALGPFTVNAASSDKFWYWNDWVPVAGTYTVKPVAYSGGSAVNGQPVTFTVGTLTPPTLALTSPPYDGYVFTGPPVTLAAAASGPFPPTGYVKFTVAGSTGTLFFDAGLAGNVASYPWDDAVAGNYTAKAELYDPAFPTAPVASTGTWKFSYQPPAAATLTMVSPAANTTITGSTTAAFTANVAGSGFDQVRFYVYEAGTSSGPEPKIYGDIKATQVSSGVFSATWTAPTSLIDGQKYETVAVAAKLVDGQFGEIARSQPAVWIYAKPAVAPAASISSPQAGGKVYAPKGNFTAYASGDGISSLKFFIYAEGSSDYKYSFGGVKSNVTAGGYSGTWEIPAEAPSGYYEVAASAYDAKQTKLADSKRVKFLLVQAATTAQSVTVTSPSAGAVLDGSTLNFHASSTGSGIAEVSFSVYNQGGVSAGKAPLWTGTAKPSAVQSSWSVPWQVPTTSADGGYEVQATAIDSTKKVLAKSSVVSFAYKRTATPQTSLTITYPYGNPVLAGPNIGFTVAASGVAPSGVVLFVFEKGKSSVAGASAVTTAVAKPTVSGWAATWAVADSQPDGEFEAVAVAYDAGGKQAARSSAVAFTYVKPERLVPLQSVMTLPKSGVVLSKAANLSATVSRKADEVYFIVSGGDTAATQPFALKASSDQDGLIWSYVWDTTAVPNGDYAAMAKATSAGETVTSEAVSFSVTNEAAAAVPTVSVSVVAPVGEETVSGSYEIHAKTGAKVDSLIFVISRKDGTVSPVTLRVPHADSTGQVWKVAWDTTRSANAPYFLKAKAFLSEKMVGESAAVSVVVENKEATMPTPLPTVEPVSSPETGETAVPTVSAEEAVAPLSVSAVRVPAEARGIVLFSAVSYGKPDAVKFTVKPVRGTGAHEVSAALDQATGRWTAMWNSKNAADGLYTVVAAAKRSDGQRVISTISYMTVMNAAETAVEPAVSAAVVAEVTVLPTAVVKEAVTTIPADTRLIAVGTVTPSVIETAGKLNEKCVAARIPAERCGAWLAWQNRDTECVRANILTKEECVSYLEEKLGRVSDEDAARSTVGLISASDIDRLNRAVTGLIGSTVRFKRAEAAGAATDAAAAPSLPDAVAVYVPLKGDKDMGLAVQASPAFVKADDGTGRKSVSAVIFIDNDGDGLPDDVERRWGTDPKNPDTDGDGFGDGTEVRSGYNPLGAGKLADSAIQAAAVDAAIVSGAPIEQPKVSGRLTSELSVDRAEVKVEEGGTTRLVGRARPGETVTVFVYSYLPVVITATADGNGNWQYDLESSLVDGQHTAYVALADETGKITEKGSPLAFFVSGAQAATEEEFFKTTTALAEEPMVSMFRWYAVGAGILVVSALVIGLAIVFRKPRGSGDIGGLGGSF